MPQREAVPKKKKTSSVKRKSPSRSPSISSSSPPKKRAAALSKPLVPSQVFINYRNVPIVSNGRGGWKLGENRIYQLTYGKAPTKANLNAFKASLHQHTSANTQHVFIGKGRHITDANVKPRKTPNSKAASAHELALRKAKAAERANAYNRLFASRR
jgi:hypothetical protein